MARAHEPAKVRNLKEEYQQREHAIRLQEAALGKDHPDVATSLISLAGDYSSQGYTAEAVPLLERALPIREKALGKDHLDVALVLYRLASLYSTQGHYSQAEPLYQRALAIREKALGKDHPDVGHVLVSLAHDYDAQGRDAEAELLSLRALAIREKALGKDHPEVGNMLRGLAERYAAKGQYAQAEPLFQRALAIREKALVREAALDQEKAPGKDSLGIATLLMTQVESYVAHGHYAEAEPLLERAVRLQETALGKDHPDVATSLMSLASNCAVQGHHAQAVPLLERALAIREAALGKNHPDVALVIYRLAGLYSAQGQYSRAEPLFQRALMTREAALGRDHPDVAQVLVSLANDYAAQNQYTQAVPLLERALVIQEKASGKDHPDVATLLMRLAELSSAQGQHAQAAPLVERALVIREKALGKDHPDVGTSLMSLARLRIGQQQLDEALPLFERAFTLSEKHLPEKVSGLSGASLAHFLSLLHEEEEYFYALVLAHPDDPRIRRLALSAALLRKGRFIEEMAGSSQRARSTSSKTLTRLRHWRALFARLSLAGPGPYPPSGYQQRLKGLADEIDAYEAGMARLPRRTVWNCIPGQPLPPEPIEAPVADRVASALPADGALIEFIAYRPPPLIPSSEAVASQSSRELRYLALLLFADGHTRAVDLGTAGPIDHAVKRFHRQLEGRMAAYQPAAEELYKLALGPLVPLLGNEVKRLFLSPDGQLSLVPFDALHDGRRFLVDAWDISYLTSGKELLPPRVNSSPGDVHIAVLADPDFSSNSTTPSLDPQAARALAERTAALQHFFSGLRSELADQPWRPLPGTRKEAEAIQRLFPRAQLLLGRDATKDALLELPRPGILHIATHGFFLEDAPAPQDSRAVGSFGAAGHSGPPRLPADPLLRSGLVLAGARAPTAAPGSTRPEDSLLTAFELASMDLSNTQLVVLSACDTGRGDVKLGQGVYGLRSALLVAGAETLVTSLWKVNDETTQELMEAYYRRLLAGQGRIAALREAMRMLRARYPHPHFWAPFVAIGSDEPLRGMALHQQVHRAP